MTIAENARNAEVLDFRDPRIAVSRSGGAVQVAVCSRTVSAELVGRLRHVLSDLVDGQGNLTVSVELPEVMVLDTHLLDVLLETAESLVARRGVLHVKTAVGDWHRPSPPPDAIA